MSSLQPHISLFDKSYQKDKSSQYKLYVELGLNGLKHTVLDIKTNTFIAFEDYSFSDIYNDHALVKPIKEIIATNTLYGLTFNAIYVAYDNNRSTLIPNAIYKADKLESYHHFNFSKHEEDSFFSDQLIGVDAYNIYSIPYFIIDLFKSAKNVSFKHFSTALIEANLYEAKKEKKLSAISINVKLNSFQICIVKDQKLAFYNSFSYQSSEDFIYYLLFVLDQLEINNEEASITLSGEVEKNSVIYSMLYKYIHTINFAKKTDRLKFSYIFEDVPHHFHYTLFYLYLCE